LRILQVGTLYTYLNAAFYEVFEIIHEHEPYLPMSFAIAIPTHPLFTPFCANAERICTERGIRLLQGSEQQCGDWLSRHTAELALVTPLVYARLALTTDLRIVPAPALLLEGLTYSASIYLKPNSKGIVSCASPNANDFLLQMGAAVLSEKFDIPLTFQSTNVSDINEALRSADAVLDYGFDAMQDVVLDVSDEWTDYLEAPLPLGVWVCRPEEVPLDITEIIHAFGDVSQMEEREIFEQEHRGVNAGRSGKIMATWNDGVEEIIQQTIEFLFYRQHVPAIAVTKVWQRDVVERL
jgi:predicted solute-binding protein